MRKIISIVLSFGMLFQQSGLLYAAGEINLANYLSSMHSAITQPDRFQPARLRYISYDIQTNDFKLLLDKGDVFKLNDATPELFNYFLIGLALPNDTFWVNLRPDAADNIIDPILEKTDIGKIFLEADLQLKKDTAGLTSPQNPEGKAYWDKLYKKAGELFGTENITIPTITRPWIVPNEVIVRETEDSAYIYKATLKVMLESDYLIGRGGSRTAPTPDQYAFSDPRLKELNEYSTRLIRETIIPKLTKEINSSKRYAQLRQVYYSLVLARWFKQKYSSHGSTRAQGASAPANSYISLIDSGNLANLASKESYDKQTYFQAYQKSFKDGEYNLKETVATPFGQSIRSYVSGGIEVNGYYDIEKFNVGAGSEKVDDALTSGSPILNLWGLFNKEKGTKNPIDILYKSYKKYNDEPDVVADRMLNVVFHFDGEIDKKDIQKIIELLEKSEEVKPYFYKPISAIFNEAVKNWDDKSSMVEVREKIMVKLSAFVIDNGKKIIEFINGFLSMNKNKKDGFVQELQEYIDNKNKRDYKYYVAIANSLHYKRHQLESDSKFTDGPAGRKLHNFMTHINLIQGFDVVEYNKRVLEELTKISPAVDDMLIADFILNYSKLLVVGSPLELKYPTDALKEIQRGLKNMNKIVSNLSKKGYAYDNYLQDISNPLGQVMSALQKKIDYFGQPRKEGISIEYILPDFGKLKDDLGEIQLAIKKFVEKELSKDENDDSIKSNFDDLSTGIKNVFILVEKLDKKLQNSAGSPVVGKPLHGNDGKEIGRYVSLGDLLRAQNNELLNSVKGKVFPALTIKESEIQGIGEDGDAILSVLLEEGILKEIPSTEGFLKVNKSLYIGNVRNIIKNDKDFPEVWRILKYSISGAKAMPVVEMSHLNKMRFAVKVSENGKLILLGLLQFDNNKVADVMGGSIEIISALSKARKKEVGVSSAVEKQVGGIDLTDRALQIKLERVGSFASTPLLLPQVKNVQDLDLDKEFEQIEALASSGISPNSRRILELFTVCHYRGEFGQRLTQIISCLKASSAIQEAEAIDSDEDFRLALMMPEVLS